MTAPDNDNLDGFEERDGDDATRYIDGEASKSAEETLAAALAGLVARVTAAGSAGLTPDDVDLLARLRRSDPGRFDAVLDRAGAAAKANGQKLRMVDLRKALDARDREHRAAKRAARAPAPVADDEPSGLPVVMLGGRNLVERARAALVALGAHPNVYQRGNELVRIIRAPGVPPLPEGATEAERRAHERDRRREPDAGAPIVQRIPVPVVQMLLSAVAEFHTPDARFECGSRRVDPPAILATQLSELGEYCNRAVRVLGAVVDAPVFLPSGRVVTAPGYDAATGITVCWSGPEVDVPEKPTHDDAKAAAEHLLGPFADFRFAGGEREQRVSKAALLASILTPLAVEAVFGPSPGFVFDADRQSAGKSLMAKACAAIVMGRLPECRPWSSSEEELRKTMGSLAVVGMPVAVFDNCVGLLDSPAVANAMTSEVFGDRVLGASASITRRWRTCLYFTANGAETRNDLEKRCRFVRLVGRGVVGAGERQGETVRLYKHNDLVAHVLEHRAAYLRSAFTILRAYVLGGRPPSGNLEGLEAWSALVGGAVAWAWGADPALADPRADANHERASVRGAVASWCAALRDRPVMAVDMMERINAGGPGMRDLREALAELAGVPDLARVSTVSLGRRLARLAGVRMTAPWGGMMWIDAHKNRSDRWVFTARCETDPPHDGDATDGAPDHPAAPPPLPPREQWPASWREYFAEREALAADGGAPDPAAVAEEQLRAAVDRGEVPHDA